MTIKESVSTAALPQETQTVSQTRKNEPSLKTLLSKARLLDHREVSSKLLKPAEPFFDPDASGAGRQEGPARISRANRLNKMNAAINVRERLASLSQNRGAWL